MFDFIKDLLGMDDEKSPLASIFREMNELGRMDTVNPFTIFGLSNRLVESAEGTDRQIVIDILLKEYVAHKSMFVRRAATIAFRRMENLDNPAVTEAMYERLSDESAWVVYDAAWFFKTHKFETGKILDKLHEIAGDAAKYDTDELEIPADSISDADLQAKYMAAKAIRSI